MQRLPEFIMFLDILQNPPSAGESLWKYHQIAFSEVYRITVFGSDNDLPFENIAGFLSTIIPGKFGDLFCPDRPIEDTQRFQSLGIGIVRNSDVLHWIPPFAQS
jgi:hypothetical protein